MGWGGFVGRLQDRMIEDGWSIDYIGSYHRSKQQIPRSNTLNEIELLKQIALEAAQREKRIAGIQKQAYENANALSNQDLYITSCRIVEQCVFRENYIISLKNSCNFSSMVVIGTVEEYATQINDTKQFALRCINKLGEESISSEVEISHIREVDEKEVALSSLLDSIFNAITSEKLDRMHSGSAIFSDSAKLIDQLVYPKSQKLAKEKCRDFFTEKYQLRYGVDECDNCGAKMFDGVMYCFECMCRKD